MASVPIRIRLAIWYALLLAAGLLLFGFALYFGLRHLLYEDFHDRVFAEAALAAAIVQTGPDGPVIDPDALEEWEDDDNNLFRLISPTGKLLVESDSDFDEIPIDNKSFTDALKGDSSFSIDKSEGPIGVATEPVFSQDDVVGVIQVGKSRSDIDDILRLVMLILAIAAPIVMGVAIIGGYFLSGRALKPVRQITSLAASIDAKDLQQRIELNLPNDEIGKLAATFNGMLARIEDAFARQRRFTGDAAHELRTPLATLQSEVELALGTAGEFDDYRTSLTDIQTDLVRMSGIVRGLLVLARSEAESPQLEREIFDVQPTIQSLLEQYLEPARARGVRLVDESKAAMLDADQDLIVQLLVNLIDNALAYANPDDTISIGNRLDEDRLHLWVEDTGPGIPAEHIEKVFEPFYRVDSGRSRATGGVGLGLSICKAIVAAHEGTLSLTSESGSGLRAEAILPPNPC